MATTKFAQMSTKKLNGLLETASEEDRIAIQAILDARNAKKAKKETAPETELSEEEKMALAEVEKEETQVSTKKEKKEKVVKEKAPKMSMEELDAAYDEAKSNAYGHRVQVKVSEEEIREGSVCGILKEKRAMAIYLHIALDDNEESVGAKCYKRYGSADIDILPEIVEVGKKANSKSRITKQKLESGEWAEVINNIRKACESEIGKTFTFDDGTTGVIQTVIRDERSQGFYWRIKRDADDKIAHKVIKYTIADDGQYVLDLSAVSGEADEELVEKFKNKKERINRALTLDDKILMLEEKIAKTKEKLEKIADALATFEAERAELIEKKNESLDEETEEAEEDNLA